MILAMLDDFDVTGVGSLRQATVAEAIIQDVAHLLADAEAVGDPTSDSFTADIRAAILDLLNDHPQVVSIQTVAFTPDPATNRLGVSIAVNGDGPITVTSSGAQ